MFFLLENQIRSQASIAVCGFFCVLPITPYLVPLVAQGQQSPRDIAKALPNSILFGSSYSAWARKYHAAIGVTSHREGVFEQLEDHARSLWAAVESRTGAWFRAARGGCLLQVAEFDSQSRAAYGPQLGLVPQLRSGAPSGLARLRVGISPARQGADLLVFVGRLISRTLFRKNLPRERIAHFAFFLYLLRSELKIS